jgi:anti-sigma factor RsiW
MNPTAHPVDAEELMAYLDGELTPERAAAVQQHLAGCDRCQQARVDLRGLTHAVAEWQIEDAPETFTAPQASLPPPLSVWRRALLGSSRNLTVAVVGAVATVAIFIAGAQRTREVSSAPAPAAAMASSEYSTAARLRGTAQPDAPRDSAAGIAGGKAARSAATSPQSLEPQRGPMIARTVTLRMVANDFGSVRDAVDRVVRDANGYVGQVDAFDRSGAARSLRATVYVPADRLDAILASIKSLGKLVEESQRGEDVTEQVTDLDARLSNARNTEKRLVDLLQKRTGDLADVLAAEREIARVREEIERLAGRRKGLTQRVTYAIVTVEVTEQEKANIDLGPQPLSIRFRNAFIDGITIVAQSALTTALVILQVGPVLLFWAVVLGVPIWRVYRRMGRAPAAR